MDFEWDDAKAASNLRKHGIAFLKMRPMCFWMADVSTWSMTARTTARSDG